MTGKKKDRKEKLDEELEEGLEQTFPASDASHRHPAGAQAARKTRRLTCRCKIGSRRSVN